MDAGEPNRGLSDFRTRAFVDSCGRRYGGFHYIEFPVDEAAALR